ncbi:MAG: putative ATP-dependent transporter SufC [Alphaproteobacteria bacterium MarineAlpha9_Bin2]|nr:MAG: putative ATP-dependent transporter SufC [Alphaproteobacteria bacterium MarineAlpha9_Bin1]PPR30531.1 MAG: putative ATP-dependent transporter SufC [Alphaproteobacteria bacterium MarineAlpha9_Bin2]
MEVLLEIEDLEVEIEERKILDGLSLTLNRGEIAALMGPNGAGKSTLASILAGKDNYKSIKGSIRYLGKDLFKMSIEERASKGLFLAFQYPVEIPGVAMSTFVKIALNAQKRLRGEKELDAIEFLKLAKIKAKELHMSEDFFKRPVNVGFSGGEKKKAEVFQMSMLDPILAILDETDSGLDVDALKVVAEGIKNFQSKDRGSLVITHYQRLLNHLDPDTVHILADGKIVKTGDKTLASLLEEKGYQGIIEAA